MNENEKLKELYKNNITFLDAKKKSYIINMFDKTDEKKSLIRLLSEKDVYKISNESYSVLEKLMKLPLVTIAYGRVSTNHRDQQNSLTSQIYYFQNILSDYHLWSIQTMYADEGLSGTGIKNRKAFNKMIEDAMANKFDMIIIKDVSRFARNTVDCLQTLRKLQKKGIIVYFMTDRIISIEQDAEMRITDAVKHAQEESRRQSVKVKFGMGVQAQKGSPLGHSSFGFEIINNQLVISQQEATIIREWGDLILRGYSQRQIRKIMENRNVKSPAGLEHWDNVDIYEILRNVKLKGDMIYRNEIVIDFLEHKTIKNDGRVKKIYVKNTHEAIFTDEEYNAIIREIESRRPKLTEQERKKYSNRYAFSGKIICGHCNHTYYRKAYHRKKEKENWVWCCSENVKNGTEKSNEKGGKIGCNSKGVHEEFLKIAFMKALQHTIINRDSIIKNITLFIENTLDKIEPLTQAESRLKCELKKVKNNKLSTIELFNDNSIDKSTLKDMLNKYNDKENSLQIELENIQSKMNQGDVQIVERKNAIYSTIKQLVNFQTDTFNEIHCKNLLHKIIVYDRDKLEIYIKGEGGESPNFFGISPLF